MGPSTRVRVSPITTNANTVGVGISVVDEEYDGRQVDRLWKWTGLITAAKMGVSCYIAPLLARYDHKIMLSVLTSLLLEDANTGTTCIQHCAIGVFHFSNTWNTELKCDVICLAERHALYCMILD